MQLAFRNRSFKRDNLFLLVGSSAHDTLQFCILILDQASNLKNMVLQRSQLCHQGEFWHKTTVHDCNHGSVVRKYICSTIFPYQECDKWQLVAGLILTLWMTEQTVCTHTQALFKGCSYNSAQLLTALCN